MVDKRPITKAAFQKLKGVGDVKLRRYGAIFLDCISGKYTEEDALKEAISAGISAAHIIAQPED